MNTWFISDTHWNHLNICQYCQRPFVLQDPSKCTRCKGTGVWPYEEGVPCIHPDIRQMNEELIIRWNQRVQPGDHVYHLGDFAFGPKEYVAKLRKRLNGDITLIKGNHDHFSLSVYRELGFDVKKSQKVFINGRRILLTHRPPTDLTDYDLCLCGHVHNAWREKKVQGKRVINVGVDVRGFRPVTLPELLEDHWNL